MGREKYRPTNNYERNIILVKRFCGKFTVLMIPILCFISIACSCYLNVINEPHIEVSIIRALTAKLNFGVELGGFENVILIGKIILYGFCIYCLLYAFFCSKNSSFEANPDFGLSLLHKFSVLILIVSAVCFLIMAATTAVFIFGSAERFESIGEIFHLSVSDLKAYKLSIVIILLFVDVILFFTIWFAQSQTDFIKSIRSSLVESVPKNKGAYVYGVFSMVLAIIYTAIAGILTFMYYCYRDAFSGMGISIDKAYVCVSLAAAYIKALIPTFLAINAFAYLSLVDTTNALGPALYSDYQVIGDAEDPNMIRKEKLKK